MTLGRIEFKRDWDPRDHPRDPDNCRFVERAFGRVRIDPVNTGLFFNVTEGMHKRPNAQATHFSDLPAAHRQKMYDEWKKRRRATGTKAESYPDLKRNIRALWDETPPEIKREGGLWYRRAKQASLQMAQKYGIDRDTAIGVVAGLSPQQDWGSNVAMADHLMKVFSEDPVFDPPDEVVDRLLNPVEEGGHTPKPRDVRPFVGKRFSEVTDPDDAAIVFNTIMRMDERKADYPGHETPLVSGEGYVSVTASGGFGPIATGISILRGVPEDDALGGHKVRSFFNNISDPDNLLGGDDVTVDTHAVQAALDVLHLPSGDEEVKDRQKREKAKAAALLAGTPTSKDLNMSGLYAMFASAFRETAEEIGVRPNHLQAAVWIHWRNKKKGRA